jgi:hypothetical protein
MILSALRVCIGDSCELSNSGRTTLQGRQVPRTQGPDGDGVLANQLRRGVLDSPVESAKLQPVLSVTRPNAGQEDVHIEEVFHGNSSKASRIACSLTG